MCSAQQKDTALAGWGLSTCSVQLGAATRNVLLHAGSRGLYQSIVQQSEDPQLKEGAALALRCTMSNISIGMPPALA